MASTLSEEIDALTAERERTERETPDISGATATSPFRLPRPRCSASATMTLQ
jgi:hypothetical protein